MATLLSSIIRDAFREGNYSALGEEPKSEEIAEALPRLRSLIASLFDTDLGELQRTWYIPRAAVPTVPYRGVLTLNHTETYGVDTLAYPPGNVKLLVKVTSPYTIHFPAEPQDGARITFLDMGSAAALTIKGNGRLLEGSANDLSHVPGDAEQSLNGRTWMYRADLGSWILLDIAGLGEASESPFPIEFDDLLICGLCLRLSTRFGVAIEKLAQVGLRYEDVRKRFKARYKQTEQMPATAEPLRSSEI